MTKDLKRYQWWEEKNNVAMRESNENIDHNNVVIIWRSFTNEVKYFS